MENADVMPHNIQIVTLKPETDIKIFIETRKIKFAEMQVSQAPFVYIFVPIVPFRPPHPMNDSFFLASVCLDIFLEDCVVRKRRKLTIFSNRVT